MELIVIKLIGDVIHQQAKRQPRRRAPRGCEIGDDIAPGDEPRRPAILAQALRLPDDIEPNVERGREIIAGAQRSRMARRDQQRRANDGAARTRLHRLAVEQGIAGPQAPTRQRLASELDLETIYALLTTQRVEAGDGGIGDANIFLGDAE